MMRRLGFRSAGRALPLGHDDSVRFLPWVVALIAYVAGLSGIGLVAVNDAARGLRSSVAGRLTVQVPAETSEARLRTVLAILRQMPGIRSAHLLTPQETARLLEPWFGGPVPIEELPMPRLIDAEAETDGSLDLAMLREQLAAVATDARVEDHRSVLTDALGAAGPVRLVLAAMLGAALLSVALIAVFATRSAIAASRAAVELLHLLGAADRDIVRPFALRWLAIGLLGGMIAAAAVLLSLAVLSGTGSLVRLAAPVAGIEFADWRLWAILAGIALATGLTAMLSAQATVLRRLARLP